MSRTTIDIVRKIDASVLKWGLDETSKGYICKVKRVSYPYIVNKAVAKEQS